MKEYANITCGILTPWDVSSTARAKTVLKLLARHSWVMPTHIGNEEPIRERYLGVGEAMVHWLDPFLWKNAVSKIEGSLWFGHGENHTCIYVHSKLNAKTPNQAHWIEFLRDACTSLEADLGYLHLTTIAEAQDKDIPYASTYAIDTGITTRELVKGIPNLCWAMVLGGHYRHLADQFRRFAPTLTKELGDDKVYVQLTDSLLGIRSNYRAFEKARLEIKEKIGEGFFSSAEENWRPTFVFESARNQE